jgi:hypothetical protein
MSHPSLRSTASSVPYAAPPRRFLRLLMAKVSAISHHGCIEFMAIRMVQLKMELDKLMLWLL